MEELMKNENLLKGLVECSTPAELQVLFEQNSITLEDGMTIEEAFKLVKEQENRELDESALEDVNGGIALGVAIGAAACLCVGGAALCFLGGYAYQTYKNYKKRK